MKRESTQVISSGVLLKLLMGLFGCLIAFCLMIGAVHAQVADTDGDGVPDVQDNCINLANGNQSDSDGDNVGDACDLCPTVQDFSNSDYNKNGIGDACECVLPGDQTEGLGCHQTKDILVTTDPDMLREIADARCGVSPATCVMIIKSKACEDLGDFTGPPFTTTVGNGYTAGGDVFCTTNPNGPGLPGATSGTCMNIPVELPTGTINASVVSCQGNIDRTQCMGDVVDENGSPMDIRFIGFLGRKTGGGTCDYDPETGQGTNTCNCPASCLPDCDDNNPCTRDWCDENGCQHEPVEQGTVCDDGNACTFDTTCDGDVCQGSAVVCNDFNVCNGLETCDPASGCQDGTPLNCDDGFFCNGAETCDPVGGCQAGNPPPLDDGIACTEDTCDEANDVVVHTPDNGQCDDGQFCNGVEFCDPASGCQGGNSPPTDDGVACTDDSCDEVNNVVVHNPNDSNCDDHNVCNGVEICDPVNNCQSGPPLNCVDGIDCTVDTCNPVGGCVNTPNNGFCDDGDFCTGQETCDPGNPGSGADGCFPGTPPSDPPAEICNDGLDNDCDTAVDCDDTDCASDPSCEAGGCQNDSDCDDFDVCTLDVCGEGQACQNLSLDSVENLNRSIDQVCPCGGPTEGGAWQNHGQYLVCVTSHLNALKDSGCFDPNVVSMGQVVSSKASLINPDTGKKCGK